LRTEAMHAVHAVVEVLDTLCRSVIVRFVASGGHNCVPGRSLAERTRKRR